MRIATTQANQTVTIYTPTTFCQQGRTVTRIAMNQPCTHMRMCLMRIMGMGIRG